jgi:hypothetical protein
MLDMDGVRCWCPCIDSAGQRTIFDVNITASSLFTVTCSGQRLHPKLLTAGSKLPVTGKTVASAGNPVAKFLVHRFFSTTRIPFSNVGFFVGVVEKYTVPLYRLEGMIWVTRGITNKIFVAATPDEEEQPTTGNTISEDEITADETDGEGSVGNDDSNVIAISSQDDSRMQQDRGGNDVDDDVDNESDDSDDEDESNQDIMDPKLIMKAMMRRKPLYEAAVKHTTLGLDIALRIIHKFVNHRYDHQSYTQIFVQGLGDNFLAFDGLVIIDARYFAIIYFSSSNRSGPYLKLIGSYIRKPSFTRKQRRTLCRYT